MAFHQAFAESPAMAKNKLRAWRNHRDLTQEDLAETSGISPSNISLLERDKIDYSGTTMQALADARPVKKNLSGTHEFPCKRA